MLATPPRSAPRPPAAAHEQQLNHLLALAEQGQAVDLNDVQALIDSPHRPTAGLAKRLLAVLLLSSAKRDAARLLTMACEDLDYRYPVVLNEAIAHAAEQRDFDTVFQLRTNTADAAAQRGDYIYALVQLLNAAGEDFHNGAKHTNTPDSVRRMVEIYERVAIAARPKLGVTPAERGQRRSPASGKLRLAHVVAQLVDGNHSTSRAADTFLKHADRARFDQFLFVSEALGPHEQHAGQIVISDWSDRRAANRIAFYEQQLGIPVIRPTARSSCLDAAAELHRCMAELQIDVAFFHGSLATPTDWMLCAWQAAPWQIDRAFGNPLFCPYVDYQFFEFAANMEGLAAICRERSIPYGCLRFGGADLSSVLTAQPIPREALNVPQDDVLLCSLGNHLPMRMSERFCRTIAAVLQDNPNATYLVVGPGNFELQRAVFGPLAGSTPRDGRVRFIGPTTISERVAQTIDIYVNEYPNGGGVAVGEAMAASKAVVCMLAGESSLSMAGAFYVGQENLVQPATDEAYAARVTQLIRDPQERARCGQSLNQRYHAEFDGRKLTLDETERIWQVMHGQPPVGIA